MAEISDKSPTNTDDGWGNAADAASASPLESSDAAQAHSIRVHNQEDSTCHKNDYEVDVESVQGINAENLGSTESAHNALPLPEEGFQNEDTNHPEKPLSSVSEVPPSQQPRRHDDESAPWSLEHQAAPNRSSDMIAAANAIAKKTDPDIGSRHRRKAKRTRTPLTKRQRLFLICGVAAWMAAGVCALLGWFNHQHYYLVCGTKSITAEQGRFWPWGQFQLESPQFRQIQIPTDAMCSNKEFKDHNLMEAAFLDALLEQSTALLVHGNGQYVDEAEQQLEQALLLTRIPERANQRTAVKRLHGNVSYWRGAAEIRQAIQSLHTAGSYLKSATTIRPNHRSDANAWAEHLRYITEEINAGPRALREQRTQGELPIFRGLGTPAKDSIQTNTPSKPKKNTDINAVPTQSTDIPQLLDAGNETPPANTGDHPQQLNQNNETPPANTGDHPSITDAAPAQNLGVPPQGIRL